MSDWSEKDYGLLLGALTGVHQDIESTKRVLRQGGKERNPLLGENPSGWDLDKAGVIAALLGTGAAASLPKEWRRPLVGAWAGFEHGLAYRNDNQPRDKKDRGFLQSGMEGPLMMAALGGLLGHYMTDEDSGVGIEIDKGKKGGLSVLLKAEKKF